ncbi:flavin-containing amine oxidoreductase-domain containing protein [Hypoxylon trugodes]|uniref:flavin-containing amine oxidoreductase-domain containing protein n=1 Tax=Hypoxylon trugodes TaxID=326681 RepID=UPI002199C6B6|nr:flavin-containing amine oxidoreductase-domain containing protein [Hypoxylon trugodes]KAI1394236.1 flavin-containing amine oxidoreductase-domain containing protein [Hypoxylon trugodes]
MRSAQETLLEEGNCIGSGPLMDLEELDRHLSILASSTDSTKTRPAALLAESCTSQTNAEPSTRETPRTESEIVVRIDDMDIRAGNTAPTSVSREDDSTMSHRDQSAMNTSTLHGAHGSSLESPESAVSDPSDLTSLPSTSLASSKATTPIDVDRSEAFPIYSNPISGTKRRTFHTRPRISIPTDVAPYDYANQCIAAAESSKLNPYALHQDEYLMLRHHLSHFQVTTYLNIRNGILRLWLNNPRVGVSHKEAIGCAKDPRWFDTANVCYDWLVRSGHINFGCLELPSKDQPKKANPSKKGKTIVVIGAGMAGLGCARQLENLSRQYAEQFQESGEEAPRVIVLEGRNRVGGRVYSRALDDSQSQHLIGFKGRRHSVECGGMIITGFERGNPLNVLVRGQMGLPYYALRSETTLYDSNGKAVDEVRDRLVEKLYNDCLERVSDYKFKNPPSKLIEGNRDLMDEGRDSSSDGQKSIAQVEEAAAALPQAPPVSQQSLGPEVSLVPVSTDRATGRTHVEPGTPAALRAAYKARLMGWALKDGVSEDHDLDLDAAAKAPNATLGSVMDEAITQYKNIVDLTPQDFRLMNWHIANLEYSNATNYNQLSIGGWDIDAGNEWEGKHTMVVGGYQTVPWGLANTPSRLDLRKKAAVKKISYDPEGLGAASVECEDGSIIEADHVVSTIPLGVLKHGNVEFNPPLPSSKKDAIGRLGYGILNKIILVYSEAFWDTSRDIFGCLRTPNSRHNLKQTEYASQRGRCFQWFNVSNTSGIPVLIGLMAGDAGFDTEHTKNDELVAEATEVLRSVYGDKVPQPVQSIVTRWGSDRFARGSYSSAGPSMRPDDYQEMAKSVGNLFFAGEHTTETHPATVHGAYLTGLRAASEVMNAMLGPIEVPTPLVLPKDLSSPLQQSLTQQPLKRKEPSDGSLPPSPKSTKLVRVDAYEIAATQHVVAQIGERPWRPQKVVANAYMLYSKKFFETARKRCEEGRRPNKGKPSPNEVRVMTSKMWKEATPEERKPYEEQVAEMKQRFNEAVKAWEDKVKEWDRRNAEIRAEYEKEHKPVLKDDEGSPASESGRERRRAKVSNYAESEGSDVDLGS